MGSHASLLLRVALPAMAFLSVGAAVRPARADEPAAPDEEDEAAVAAEPEGGAGVSPIELVPKVELRQSFQKLGPGVSVHDTTAEIDIQFMKRLLLRYQIPHRLLETPAGQTSGFGDVQLGVIATVVSGKTSLLVLLAGAVLDTASAAQLGTGKQQISCGAGGALKPLRWLLPYVVVQEQLSVGGDSARPDVNQLSADLGVIVFGRQYNWLKLDALQTVDFPGGAQARLFGTLEAGSLLVGRIGLFVRAGTQVAGKEQLDYSLAAGIRYLFRLAKGKPKEQ